MDGRPRCWSQEGPAVSGPIAPQSDNVPAEAGALARCRFLAPAAPAAPAAAGPADAGRWIAAGAVLLAALCTTAALVFAWNTQQQRVKSLEIELVKRQQDSGQPGHPKPAPWPARPKPWPARPAARVALLDAACGRNQPAAHAVRGTGAVSWRVHATTKTCWPTSDNPPCAWPCSRAHITGSADPLLQTLQQADERLARYNQPQLERVRRAVAQDLDRVRAAGASDIGVLSIRVDELIRMVDELPLASRAAEADRARRCGGDAYAARSTATAGCIGSARPRCGGFPRSPPWRRRLPRHRPRMLPRWRLPRRPPMRCGPGAALVGQQGQRLLGHVWKRDPQPHPRDPHRRTRSHAAGATSRPGSCAKT